MIINYIQNSRSIISYKNGSMDKVMMCAISVAVGCFWHNQHAGAPEPVPQVLRLRDQCWKQNL